MRIELGEFEVTAMDADGYELANQIFPSKKEAIKYAKIIIDDRELIQSGMQHVDVRNHKGECIADFFVD